MAGYAETHTRAYGLAGSLSSGLLRPSSAGFVFRLFSLHLLSAKKR